MNVISNLIKVRPVGAKLFHADGQTDLATLTFAFRNFANAHAEIKNIYVEFLLLNLCLPATRT
jgi:hypothetical protein